MEGDFATPVTFLRRAGRQGLFPYVFLAPAVVLLLALTVGMLGGFSVTMVKEQLAEVELAEHNRMENN